MSGLREALLARYPRPAWALFFEVPNGKGARGGTSRYADAIAVGLWPSVGHEIHGFEFKSSRSDWLSELKQPEKANSIMKRCDRWWLLTETQGVVAVVEEIPKYWGFLHYTGKRLKVVKPAPQLEPEPLTINFVAALLARSQDGMIHEAQIAGKLEAAKAEGRWSQDWQARRDREELEKIREHAKQLKAETGIDVSANAWDFHGTVGAMKLAQSLGHTRMERLAENAELLEAMIDFETAARRVIRARQGTSALKATAPTHPGQTANVGQ